MKLDAMIARLTEFRDNMLEQEKTKNLPHTDIEVTGSFLLELGERDEDIHLYELDITEVFAGGPPFRGSDPGLHLVLVLDLIPEEALADRSCHPRLSLVKGDNSG